MKMKMRTACLVVGAGTAVCLATAPLSAQAVSSTLLQKRAAVAMATFDMNEPAGATTMIDTSGNGLDTALPGSVQTGFVFDGAVGYHWDRKPPNEPPADPSRIIQVADTGDLLDPQGDTFTVEIRYRTKEKFGNIIQKGQSASKGGQWKIQNPQGRPSCLFKGSLGRDATRSPIALNDNLWHTLTCLRTPTSVSLYVDVINNTIPMTIGGKINCDQITITCDYFSGEIDYVHVSRGS
jgi:hypothetical protein